MDSMSAAPRRVALPAPKAAGVRHPAQEIVTVHGTTPVREAGQRLLEYRWLGMLSPGVGSVIFWYRLCITVSQESYEADRSHAGLPLSAGQHIMESDDAREIT
jgi:hypothetical protein